MTGDDLKGFFERIDRLTPDHKPLFGKMNVNQMVCHCADQVRMALGSKIPLEYGNVDAKEIIAMAFIQPIVQMDLRPSKLHPLRRSTLNTHLR